MFKNFYIRFYFVFVRYFFYVLFRRKKIKKKNDDVIERVIVFYQKNFIEKNYLNPDLTKGSSTVNIKNARKLIAAFINKRQYKDDDDFYLIVAKEWVRGYENKFHKTSLLFIILFLLWWISGTLLAFFQGGFSGWLGLLFIFGIYFFPIIGFFSALFGSGWKRIVLLLTNIILGIVCFFIIS